MNQDEAREKAHAMIDEAINTLPPISLWQPRTMEEIGVTNEELAQRVGNATPVTEGSGWSWTLSMPVMLVAPVSTIEMTIFAYKIRYYNKKTARRRNQIRNLRGR